MREGGHFESPERGGGGRGRSQRDFSCPGQKKEVRPWLSPADRPPARLVSLTSPPPFPLSLSLSPPTFLTQLPAVTDGDMCHITSTCVHRVGRRPNRRSELSTADMWLSRHSNLQHLRRVFVYIKLPRWKIIRRLDFEAPGQHRCCFFFFSRSGLFTNAY